MHDMRESITFQPDRADSGDKEQNIGQANGRSKSSKGKGEREGGGGGERERKRENYTFIFQPHR